MASIWIIDGFNLLRQSKDLAAEEFLGLDRALNRLFSRLRNFAERIREPVVCVLDATGSIEKHRREEKYGFLTVVYSRGAETADEVVIEMAEHETKKAIVVTSDRAIGQAVKKAGASWVLSDAFERLSMRLDENILEEDLEETGFDPKKGTKKRGPARRAPKNQRKVLGKIKKWTSS